MVARSRYFVASLWAALPPAVLLIIGGTTLLLFPEVHRLGEWVSQAGGLALLLVPCAYTAGVVVTYSAARMLYELRWMSRRSFIALYCVLAVLFAALVTAVLAAGSMTDIARSFALFLVLSLVAAGSAAFVWWRVASRGAADEDLMEPRVRVRRRMRRGFLRRLARR